MEISRSILMFNFLLLIILLNACSRNDSVDSNSTNINAPMPANVNAENVPQDNVEELAKIIKLDFTPEEATFSEVNPNTKNNNRSVSAPNEKKLVAVLKFSSENANQVAALAEKYKPAIPADIDAENWFPAELIAQSQLTGDESLKGSAYAANDFLQTPYADGKLTRINNTDYFILELTSF